MGRLRDRARGWPAICRAGETTRAIGEGDKTLKPGTSLVGATRALTALVPTQSKLL